MQVLQEGVAFCLQELEIGVSAISVPIFHEDQKTSLSLSVVGERSVVEFELDRIIQLLKDVSIKASEHLKSMHMLTSIKL